MFVTAIVNEINEKQQNPSIITCGVNTEMFFLWTLNPTAGQN